MIGVSSLCMLHADLYQVLETVSKSFSHIEIIYEGNHINLEPLESYSMTVSFHAPFSDLNIGSLNKAILKESLRQISACIEQASTYNACTVCIHPGHLSPLGLHFKNKSDRVQIESLKILAQKAEDVDIILGVENMPSFPILMAKTPEEVAQILNEVDSPHLKFTFDVGHANITGNVAQFLPLKDYMVTAHLHDNHGDQDIHLSLGEGTLPLDIIKELSNCQLTIEVYTYQDVVKSADIIDGILS